MRPDLRIYAARGSVARSLLFALGVFCAASALLASCTYPESLPGETGPESRAAPVPMPRPDDTGQRKSTEQLLAKPPAEFKMVYRFNNADTRIMEFVPSAESDTDWNVRITFESHAHLVDSDPIDVLIAEVKRLQDMCSFVQNFNLFSGFENGYPTSVRLMMCGTLTKLKEGQVSLAKVIQGSDYLYIVTVARRVPPFDVHEAEVEPPEIAVWSNYLSRISVCDETSEAHPCPEPEAE
jgi:hypothetical protein